MRRRHSLALSRSQSYSFPQVNDHSKGPKEAPTLLLVKRHVAFS